MSEYEINVIIDTLRNKLKAVCNLLDNEKAAARLHRDFKYYKSLVARDEESFQEVKSIGTPHELVRYIHSRNQRILSPSFFNKKRELINLELNNDNLVFTAIPL